MLREDDDSIQLSLISLSRLLKRRLAGSGGNAGEGNPDTNRAGGSDTGEGDPEAGHAEGSGSNDRAGLEAGHTEGSGGDADEAGPEATHDGDDAQSVARKVASDVEEMKSWPY